MSADLTLVVAAHDETALCGPSMRAADMAVESARSRGLTVERVVALLSPTDATSRYFDQPRFDPWRRTVLDATDPATAFDSLTRNVSGRLMAFLTVDTIISENFLTVGAAQAGPGVIAQPELAVTFDGLKAVRVNVDSTSPLLTPHVLYVQPLYGGTCVAPVEAYTSSSGAHDLLSSRAPLRSRRFVVETLSSGWRHVVAKDTVVFERCRGFPGAPADAAWAGEPARLSPLRVDRARQLLPRSDRADS